MSGPQTFLSHEAVRRLGGLWKSVLALFLLALALAAFGCGEDSGGGSGMASVSCESDATDPEQLLADFEDCSQTPNLGYYCESTGTVCTESQAMNECRLFKEFQNRSNDLEPYFEGNLDSWSVDYLSPEGVEGTVEC